MQRSRSRARLDDESSIDELASSALLHNVPPEPVRAPSLQSRSPTEEFYRPKSSKSTKTVAEDLDKPLPPIPAKDSFAKQQDQWQSRPALTMKTTNLKVAGNGEKQHSKPNISRPMPQNPATAPSSSRPTTGHSAQATIGTQTSTADAADLSRKISNLMHQAATQELQTKRKAALQAKEAAGKLSPFQRGKQVFVKATRAIKDRLSSSSNHKSRKPRRPMSNSSGSDYDTEPPPQYDTDEEIRRGRLDRRIAEGENLSNPKIRSLIGDGHIPRKPLPVYESMKARTQFSDSPDDPFSDDNETEGRPPPHDYSGFDFDFAKRKPKRKIKHESLPAQDQKDGTCESSNQHLAVPGSPSEFSNMVSGLTQHSQTEFFSSSPVGYSTPRIRLDPQPATNPREMLSDTILRSPSILEFSFEAQSDEESQALASNHRVSDGSNSVKRKGATGDLRSQISPAHKKAKTGSLGSKDDLRLAAGISQLDTGNERTPLSPKSNNVALVKPNRNASKRRGLSIFDVGKGKAPEVDEDNVTRKTRTRSSASRRSSSSRPSSTLFSRESRAGMRRLAPIDGDRMDIDELETDDIAYQVGGKKT